MKWVVLTDVHARPVAVAGSELFSGIRVLLYLGPRQMGKPYINQKWK